MKTSAALQHRLDSPGLLVAVARDYRLMFRCPRLAKARPPMKDRSGIRLTSQAELPAVDMLAASSLPPQTTPPQDERKPAKFLVTRCVPCASCTPEGGRR